MQEAKGSFNAYYVNSAGNKDQFTLRQEDGQSDSDFILRVQQFQKDLVSKGWKPFGSNGHAAVTPAAHAPAVSSPTAAAAAQASAVAPSSTVPTKTIDITAITLAAGGAHPRWVVKGGKLTKFGVTCWPETLEAAGIADKLNPVQENKPKGQWIAHYIERQNEDGRWVPDKVTKIERKK